MRRIWLIATAVPALALAVASLVSLPKKLIYNASASAPMGLYWLEISVNGSVVASAKRRDGQGREMPDWHGCHILTEQTVFLLQDHPQSFDGRYFGPVDRRLIIGRATRLRMPWRNRDAS